MTVIQVKSRYLGCLKVHTKRQGDHEEYGKGIILLNMPYLACGWVFHSEEL